MGADRIYHLTFATDWHAAVAAGEYVLSARDLTLEQEGFIHCSFADQLPGVAQRFWQNAADVLLLTIAVDRLTSELRIETYPHIYGPLNPDAVVGVVPLALDGDGQLVLPAVWCPESKVLDNCEQRQLRHAENDVVGQPARGVRPNCAVVGVDANWGWIR